MAVALAACADASLLLFAISAIIARGFPVLRGGGMLVDTTRLAGVVDGLTTGLSVFAGISNEETK